MIRIVSQMRWWPIKLSNMLNLLVFSVLVTLSCLVCYTTSNHQHHLNEVEPQPEEPLSNLSPESPSISAAYTDDAYRDKPPYLRYLAGCTEDILNSISSLGCASIMPTSDNTRVICVPFMPSSSASQLSTSSSSPPPPPSSAAANLDCRVLLLLPISPPRASGQVTPIGDAVELPVDTSGEQARRRKRRDRTFRNLMSGELAAGGSGRQGVGVARYMSEDELGDVRTAGSGDTGYSPEVQVPATPPQRLGDGKLRCDDERCSLRRPQFEEDTDEAGAGAETGRDEDNYVRAIVGDNTALDSSQRLLASRRSWLPSGQVKEYADKLSAAVTERLTNGVQVEVEAARYNDLSDETQPRAFSRSTTSPSSTGSSPSRHQRDTLGKVPVLLVKLVDTQQLPFDGRGRSNGGGNARNRFIAGSHTGAPPLLRRHSIRVHRSELMNNGTMVPPTSTLYMDLATYQSMMPSVADGEIGALLPMLSTSGGRATASTTTTTSSTSNGVAQVDLDGGMNRYAEASAMMKSQSAAPGNFDLSGSGIGSGGELPPTCNLNKYGFRASKSDALGNSCSGWVKASICYGACQTGEIADWLFPYKKSIHKVCTHGSRVRRQVQLTNCTSSEVEPSLREYHYVDATSCVCKKCSSADTVCMGSLTSATLEDNATF